MFYKVLAVLLLLPNTAFAMENQFQKLYSDMYKYMISKDVSQLGSLLDDSFVLVHMTGMRQTKNEYLKAIENGTLNYFLEELEHIDTSVSEDSTVLVGKSKVSAAVFGGGRHTWRLKLDIKLKHKDDQWLITEVRASTY